VVATSVCPTLSDQQFMNFFVFCGPIRKYAIDRQTKVAVLLFQSEESKKIAVLFNKCQLGTSIMSVIALQLYDSIPPEILVLMAKSSEPQL